MTGAEVVAIISVSAGALTSILATCFQSRCTSVNTPCISCVRKLREDEEEKDEKKEKEKHHDAKPVSPNVIEQIVNNKK